ncbi:cysteine proteinase inhibitor 1-like [Chenopodium quinoa]|uniref:Cystatin domain-containing protein n=1 Tax=Chenopodium quinoa TaxID=63459 RepID=A0A803M1L5_CHEQI|nr:cysteine proteinase inhibitor 1-like [Chenopodium quinoa]
MRTDLQLYCLFSLLLIIVVSAAEEIPPPDLPLGGYSPITNLSDPHVIEVAQFAVKEHNMLDEGHKVKLLSILKGWTQVVAGLNYRLIITAKTLCSHADVHRYEVVVYERPWQHFMKLTSFNQTTE